ncbi:nitroreductase family protein [Paracoccus suum]|nr:nitroreductase family protein [Paracoccus suum]
MDLFDALRLRRTVREYSDAPLTAEVVRQVIWAAQGATGQEGGRTAPSAHALYPLRLRLAVRAVAGVETGIYDPCADPWQKLATGDHGPALEAAAIGPQPWLANAAAILTVCVDMMAAATHFADQPPYGERGLRYGWIEAGAAAQNALLAATATGLGAALIAGFHDEATVAAIQLPPPLVPACHICLGHLPA